MLARLAGSSSSANVAKGMIVEESPDEAGHREDIHCFVYEAYFDVP